MRQLGHEEKAALLLTADDDDEGECGNEHHHEMASSPPQTTTDRFPVVRKRPRTYRRYEASGSHPVLCFAVILGAFVFGCVSGVVIMLYRFSQDATNVPSAFNAQQLSTNVDLAIQTKLFESIAKGNFADLNGSTESDTDAANRLYQQWQLLSPSLSQVKNFSYDISLSRYASASQWSGIQLLDGKSEKELLKIDRSTTEDLVSFASLIKSDTVDANAMFYVNYGRPEDFAYLIQNQIQFTAPNKSIVFMRRQAAVLSQTEQIHQAIYYGFSALVLFDDHENQRVTVTDNRQSFFRELVRPTKEADNVPFLDGGMKTKVHPIAVLVLSYEDVQRIFGSLQPDSNQWSACPAQWHDSGTLMKIGGTLTSIKLRLTVQMQVAQVQLPVVMGSIRGSVDPDRFVMLGFRLGCSQQTRIANELIQACVNQVKTGWNPRRSIVFSAWAGIDYDQYAVNRWISENSRFIERNLITYLDLGAGVVGNATLNLRGSALLQQVASRAADYVPSPLPHNHTCHNRGSTTSSSLSSTTTAAMVMSQEGGHHHDGGRKRRSSEHENHVQTETKCEPHKLLDEWLRANGNRSVEIVQIVDTESVAALLQLRHGIPSMLIEMTDEPAVNTNAFYVRHIPTVTRPTIEPKVLVAYTQFVSELLRQLADEPLLAFNLNDYADRLDKLVSEYGKEFQHPYRSLEWHIGSFSAFAKTVTDLTKSIRQVQSRIDRIPKKDYVALQAMNRQMIEFERLFIGPDALRWMNSPDKIYAHVLLGPAFGLSSTAVAFPSLSNILAGVPGDPPETVCNTAKLLSARMSEHFALIRRTLAGFDGLLGSDTSR